MLQEQKTILRRIGNALRGQSEDVTHEPIRKRWVGLIHFLDEQERKRGERAKPQTEPRVPRPRPVERAARSRGT
jgi:hypothetical protein